MDSLIIVYIAALVGAAIALYFGWKYDREKKKTAPRHD